MQTQTLTVYEKSAGMITELSRLNRAYQNSVFMRILQLYCFTFNVVCYLQCSSFFDHPVKKFGFLAESSCHIRTESKWLFHYYPLINTCTTICYIIIINLLFNTLCEWSECKLFDAVQFNLH